MKKKITKKTAKYIILCIAVLVFLFSGIWSKNISDSTESQTNTEVIEILTGEDEAGEKEEQHPVIKGLFKIGDFIKDNWFSLLVLIGVGIAYIYIKKRNKKANVYDTMDE